MPVFKSFDCTFIWGRPAGSHRNSAQVPEKPRLYFESSLRSFLMYLDTEAVVCSPLKGGPAATHTHPCSLCTMHGVVDSRGHPEVRAPLTLVDGVRHRDADADAVCSLWALRLREVLAVGQLQPHEDHGVGPREDILRLTQDVLQDLTFVAAQVSGLWGRRGFVTVGEGIVAQGGDGEL